MILLKLLKIAFLINIISGQKFMKYHLYGNLTISDQFKPLLQLRESFQVSQYNPESKCMLSCNNEPNCNSLTIDKANICTLFNNQTTLIHTATVIGIKFYSQIELKMCFDEFYADLTALVCRAQKLFSIPCLFSNECLNSLGLQCFNFSCQCPPDSE